MYNFSANHSRWQSIHSVGVFAYVLQVKTKQNNRDNAMFSDDLFMCNTKMYANLDMTSTSCLLNVLIVEKCDQFKITAISFAPLKYSRYSAFANQSRN